MLHKASEVVGANILTLLCIVDYFTKFPFVKKTSDLSAESLIKSVKIVFEEVGLPEIQAQISNQRSLKTCARNLAYIMWYHHLKTIKVMDRWGYA